MDPQAGMPPPAGPSQHEPAYNIEVVCRTRSADGEAPPGPRPATADPPLKKGLWRRAKARSAAAVHPSPSGAGLPFPGADVPAGERPHSASVFDMLDHGRKPRALWKQRVAAYLDGVQFTVISIVFTLLILYADLIREAATPPAADPYFLAFTIFAMFFFLAEIVVSSLAKPAYFCKFYFFMDLVAAISLLCQVPGFMDAITGSGGDGNGHNTLSRAAKAAQAGARAARIMQVVALIQLLRLKAARLPFVANLGTRSTLTLDETSSGTGSVGEDGSGAGAALLGVKSQSRIGEKVTERTMRKVILGVLLMLLVLPVFDANIFLGHPTILEDGGLAMLHDLYQQEGNTTSFQTAVTSYIDENVYKLGTGHTGYVYGLQIYNITLFMGDPDLRQVERQTAVVETPQCDSGPWEQCYQSKAWVNIRWAARVQALLDIGRITFLLAVLSLASVLFIRDTDELVLQPIERMVNKVKSVSQNPLAHHASASAAGKGGGGGGGKQLETRILEQSISKICSLLSVGFGEAGAEVIADNIKSGGDLNPMVPGRKVTAIFGFCDIRQFTDATEVLQEEVMEFVNSIANIVHTEVSLHGGAANKNIGDAFLLVWKLPGSHHAGAPPPRSRSSVVGAKAAAGGGGAGEEVTHLADAALASFIVVQAALKRSRKLTGYGEREDLNARMPDFSVKMGFGLHVGWAIEGAIGSRYKIDASYLSPHVNMAARLEAATKQFGVTMLLSEPFVAMLSPAVRRRVRQIDCVTVKGSRQPIGLYTYDVSLEGVAAPPGPAAAPASTPSSSAADLATPGVKSSGLLRRSSASSTAAAAAASAAAAGTKRGGGRGGKADHESFSDYPYYDEFEEHPDLLATRAVDDAFLQRFGEGFQAYRAGDWRAAAEILEETRVARRSAAGSVVVDGPSETLLGVMREQGLVPPQGWAGFRELTEK